MQLRPRLHTPPNLDKLMYKHSLHARTAGQDRGPGRVLLSQGYAQHTRVCRIVLKPLAAGRHVLADTSWQHFLHALAGKQDTQVAPPTQHSSFWCPNISRAAASHQTTAQLLLRCKRWSSCCQMPDASAAAVDGNISTAAAGGRHHERSCCGCFT